MLAMLEVEQIHPWRGSYDQPHVEGVCDQLSASQGSDVQSCFWVTAELVGMFPAGSLFPFCA